jgi:hypothetical protein
MGLAAYGDPDHFGASFQKLIEITDQGYMIDASIIQFRLPVFDPLTALFGRPRARMEPIIRRHYGVAAAWKSLPPFPFRLLRTCLRSFEQQSQESQSNHLKA